jgi:predicted ester cyclase
MHRRRSHRDPGSIPFTSLGVGEPPIEGFPDIQWTLEEMVSEEDKIAARFTMRGTHQGPFFGVPPTGREIVVEALNLYHLSAGKIVEEYGHPDMLGLMQQIGALPEAS